MLLVAALVGAAPAAAATIKVNTTVDDFGGGGSCALREAVQTANTNAAFGGCGRSGGGPDVIVLRSGKTYLRSITGTGDDNSSGDLDLSSNLTIRPLDRKGRATIDAVGLSRVIDVFAGAKVSVSRVNLVGGTLLVTDTQTGGGALIAAGSRLTLSRSGVSGNSINGVGGGGGIENGGTLVATRIRVARNRIQSMGAANGGGIENTGTATIDRSTVTGNQVSNVGGGVENNDGRLTVTDSTISGNRAGYVGGGLYLGGAVEGGSVVLRGSTIVGNTAMANSGNSGGGAIQMGDYGMGKAKLSNITISGNSSAGLGGGIAISAGQMSILNSTIVFNTADSNADGIGGIGGIVGFAGFANTILYGNRDLNPGTKHPDCFNAAPQGNNLLGDTSDCGAGPTDITGRAPKLAPLSANGGPTMTHLLRRGSPAIDKGSPKRPGKGLFASGACTARDQRGIKRPQGTRCDIGAFERRGLKSP